MLGPIRGGPFPIWIESDEKAQAGEATIFWCRAPGGVEATEIDLILEDGDEKRRALAGQPGAEYLFNSRKRAFCLIVERIENAENGEGKPANLTLEREIEQFARECLSRKQMEMILFGAMSGEMRQAYSKQLEEARAKNGLPSSPGSTRGKGKAATVGGSTTTAAGVPPSAGGESGSAS